ncbi:MAG: 7TM-DISM domain-containing protein [Spirosomataceae bacterium]
MKILRYILLLISCQTSLTYAQKTYWVQPNQTLSLDGFLETYEDTTCQIKWPQIISIQQQHLFKPLSRHLLNSGYSSSHHWLHFRLNTNAFNKLYLEIDNPRINQLWFYEVKKDSLLKKLITGDLLPFKSRGFPNHNWVFPLTLEPNTPIDIYIMAAKRHEVLGLRVKLWQSSEFEDGDRKNYLFWGILAGITSLILLINLIAWVATKQSIYFWFICLILAILFHIAGQSGLGFQYFWTNSPAFNWLDPQLISGWFIMVAQIHFMQEFIRTKCDQ